MTQSWWSQLKRWLRHVQDREAIRHRMEKAGRQVALAGDDFSKRKVESLLNEVDSDKENWAYYLEGFSYGYEQGFIEYMNEYRKRNSPSKKVSIKR